jgi:transcription elongation factor Elf1
MNCEKCGSENVEWKTIDKNRHFVTVLLCKDCNHDRLPTNEERRNFNG